MFGATMTPSIFIRDPELIKAIGIKNFESFQNHNVIFDGKSDPLLGGNLASLVDDHWRETRSMLSPSFTSSKIKSMYPLMVEIANNLVEYMSGLTRDNDTMVDIKDLFTKYTNDVIAICAFGLDVDSFKNPNNEFYVYGRKISNFENQKLLVRIKIYMAALFPKLVKIFKIKFVDENVANFFKSTIADVVKTRDDKGINRPDMIQLMMNARNTDKKHLKLDIDEMSAQAFIFFLAGFETTSTQMCLLAYQLAIYPDIQKRLQNEIDQVMEKTAGDPSYEAIQEMQYLDAVFNESLRRDTQATCIDRVCNKPFELPPALPGAKPFVISKDMIVGFSGRCTHWDSKYYEDPEKFDPDRYYRKKVSINDELNLGFGIGPRMCIGNRFAIVETKILLFHVLKKFRIIPTAATRSPLKYDKSKWGIVPEGGYWLKIKPRSVVRAVPVLHWLVSAILESSVQCTMELIACSLIVVIICALYYYAEKKLNYFKDRNVPYAPGLPILGNMAKFLFRRQHFTEMMLDIYRMYPEAKYVGAFDFGMRPVILLRDPELIKTVTIKNFDSFPNHYVVFDEKLDPLFGGNLLNMVDDQWREARNLLSPAFTSSKMKSMFQLMLECAKNFSNHLSELAEKSRQVIDMKNLFTRYTNDVIATCAFGISVDSLKNPKNDFYLFGKKAINFENFSMWKFFIANTFPKLLKVLGIRFIDKGTAKFFTNVIDEMVRTRDEHGISRPDMIQLMMNARETEKKYLKLDINEMTAQAFIFFLAGFETTSTQMCLLTHQLAINPDIQDRLQNEIDQVLEETGGNPSYDAIQGMPYLDAVFNESIRRDTQALLLDRVCIKPFELPPALPGTEPFVIPKGMRIWISGTGIHLDPKYYENPEKFDPERYYQKKVSINDEMNLGFGIGPRMCIGNRFAILETKILLFYVLSKFSLIPTATTCSPLKYDKSKLGMVAEGGYRLEIRPRSQ
ncbi:cytochrome P450 9e2-like [Phymastichus coffea]|uniref:cytochrome P450 9e2-like n=1 Tax=Phymastichus coffea TaxID=108790 RepID=UPI00273CDDC9|nr:cytochrome P450 9e2-like [Phymastichus coffea]